MGLLQEYLEKRPSEDEVNKELMALIKEYNKKYSTYLLIYSVDTTKDVPPQNLMLTMRDYQNLYDMLRSTGGEKVDVYLETPGGMAEAAEEIAELLHRQFKNVEFVIVGEAKSAGTILAMSGNEISLTGSGSLGPIDAQVGLARMQISAHDYKQWMDEKQKEYADPSKPVNQVDAIMIAQISPGEVNGIYNALDYAHDLVKKWLPLYKFAHWKTTKTRKMKVTKQYKEERAQHIAEQLSNHTQWRSHGRSLKIAELEKMGLMVNDLDKDSERAEILYRINTLIRYIYLNSPIVKILMTADSRLLEQVQVNINQPQPGMSPLAQGQPGVIGMDATCEKCGTVNKFFVPVNGQPPTPPQPDMVLMPNDQQVPCKNCGNPINLVPLHQQLAQIMGGAI